MTSPKGVQNNHMAGPVRLQGNKPYRNSPEPSELPPEPSGSCLQNLHQHTPESSGTCLRNLPPEPTPAHNSRESFGTYLQNLHRHTPELSGTFWNLPPEPTPAHTGTLRNLPPEPAPATRTGTHRNLSGLKTPLTYAVGEKGKKNILK